MESGWCWWDSAVAAAWGRNVTAAGVHDRNAARCRCNRARSWLASRNRSVVSVPACPGSIDISAGAGKIALEMRLHKIHELAWIALRTDKRRLGELWRPYVGVKIWCLHIGRQISGAALWPDFISVDRGGLVLSHLLRIRDAVFRQNC